MAKYASVLFKSLFATLLRQSLKVHYKFCLYTFEDHIEAIRSYTWLVSLNREEVRHDLTKKSRRDLHHFYLEKCCHQAGNRGRVLSYWTFRPRGDEGPVGLGDFLVVSVFLKFCCHI